MLWCPQPVLPPHASTPHPVTPAPAPRQVAAPREDSFLLTWTLCVPVKPLWVCQRLKCAHAAAEIPVGKSRSCTSSTAFPVHGPAAAGAPLRGRSGSPWPAHACCWRRARRLTPERASQGEDSAGGAGAAVRVRGQLLGDGRPGPLWALFRWAPRPIEPSDPVGTDNIPLRARGVFHSTTPFFSGQGPAFADVVRRHCNSQSHSHSRPHFQFRSWYHSR